MTTATAKKERTAALVADEARVTTGVAAAAVVSSGIGTFVMGLMTTGAELSEGLHNFLNWWNPAGPLSGKTGMAIILWLVSWTFLNASWKNREYDLKRAFTITMVLIFLGFLLTFPPIFTFFA